MTAVVLLLLKLLLLFLLLYIIVLEEGDIGDDLGPPAHIVGRGRPVMSLLRMR